MSDGLDNRRAYRRVTLLVLLAPLLAFVAALATHGTASAAACKQWTGATSTNWTVAGNWTPAGAPSASDCVVIDNSVVVNNDPTINTGTTVTVKAMTLDARTLTINGTGSLTLSGPDASSFPSGRLAGSGTLNIGGSLAWGAGSMSGTGKTVVTSGGTLNIAPGVSGYAMLDTRTLTNNVGGTVTFAPVSTGSPWYFGGETCAATTFVNNGSVTYTGPNSSDPGIISCGTSTITNGATGTFTKSGGTGQAAVLTAINNAGTVTATAGTLQFNGGSLSGTGAFVGTPPGRISLGTGTFTLGQGASLSGVSVDGATVVAGTTSGSSAANVTMSGTNFLTAGGLDGNGVFTIAGTLNWSAGGMVSSGTGTGTTLVSAGGALNISPTVGGGYPILDTRTLTNGVGGAVTYAPLSTGTPWYFGGVTCIATTFVNNGSFTYAGPNSSDPGIITCGTHTIINGATGTFTKNAGTAISNVAPGMRNAGTVSATAGTLQLAGDPTSAVGTFGAVTPGRISLFTGTFVLGNGSSFTGGVSVDGATVVAGTTSGSSAANVTLSGTNFLTAGGLDGNGVFTIAGTLNWSAGGMVSSGTGTGTTLVSAGGALNISPTVGGGYPILDTRTLTNGVGGAVTYAPLSTGTPWYFGGVTCIATTFVNNGSFTYAGPNSSDPGIITCGPHTIINGATGTFTKNAGTATSTVAPTFDNNGTIAVSAGTLQFTGTFPAYNGTNTLTKGTYNLTSPGVLQFPGAAITINGANITLNGGAGALIQDTAGNSALTNLASNTGSLTVLNRTLTVTPFTNSGTVTVGPGGSASVLASTGAYTQSGGSTVLANATSTLQTGGSGNVTINGGTLSGIGIVKTPTATTALSNAGTVSPGSPASGVGTLTVVGKYTQTTAGALKVNIAGTPGSGNFDKLSANRAISLHGALNIDSTGYTHSLGDTFTIVSTSAGGVTGTFSAVTGIELGGSYYYEVVYGASDVQLVVHARDADTSVTTSSPTDVVANPTQPVNNISWTLTVNNAGPAVATNVTLSDTIPTTVQFVSATPSQGTCGTPNGAGVLTCTLGSIQPNPGTPPTVQVVVKPLDPGALVNQAVVSATENDPNAANNTVTDSVTATPETDVTYVDVKDTGFASATAKVVLGKTIQYTFLGTLTHHLTDQSALIDSGSAGPRTYFRFQLQAAGKYVVSDSAVAGTNTITVAPTVKDNHNGTYKITWSLYATTPAGYGYDATVTGPLGTVTNLAPTRAEKFATYTPTDGPGKYTVKDRIRNKTTGKTTGFAQKAFTV